MAKTDVQGEDWTSGYITNNYLGSTLMSSSKEGRGS
jgi:hypothetical protein